MFDDSKSPEDWYYRRWLTQHNAQAAAYGYQEDAFMAGVKAGKELAQRAANQPDSERDAALIEAVAQAAFKASGYTALPSTTIEQYHKDVKGDPK